MQPNKKIETIIDFLEKEIKIDVFTNQVRIAYVLYQALNDYDEFMNNNNRRFLKKTFFTYQSISYDYQTTYGAFERSIYRYIENLLTDDFVDLHKSINDLVLKFRKQYGWEW